MEVYSNDRINRYIMECKCSSSIRPVATPLELIDTLWNVNEDEREEITQEEMN